MRNPAALFFTAILPVIFLCLFVSIFGNERAGEEYGNIRISTLQVPAFIALAVVSASFVGLAIGLVERARGRRAQARARHAGARRGSSSPGGSAPRSSARRSSRSLLIAIGAIAFGVTGPDARRCPGSSSTLVVGAFAFCALGIAYTRAIRSEEAAPAMTNAVVLPLYFISGVFVPVSELPEGLRQSPTSCRCKPFVDALTVAFDPRTSGRRASPAATSRSSPPGACVGLILALRFFAWTPRQQAG